MAIAPAVQALRNNVSHGVLINDTKDGLLFHLRSKDRVLTKNDILESEELTNYFGNLVKYFRLGLPDLNGGLRITLPGRPAIPTALAVYIQTGKK
jgi:hypothetical protein